MNGQWLSVTLKSSCVPSHVCVFVCQPRSQAKCTYTVVSVSRISFPFDFKYSSWARSSSSSIFQDSFMGFYYYESEDCTTPSFWICIQAAVPPPLLSFRWAIRKSSKGIEDMYYKYMYYKYMYCKSIGRWRSIQKHPRKGEKHGSLKWIFAS